MTLKKIFLLLIILISTPIFSQIDYSDSWEDFYSYNNVKDFYFDNNKMYAVCDNAMFIYDIESQAYQKISSVHGLSGETTSSFYYSNATNRIIIGYETGLIEVINPDGSIHVSNDIVRLNVSGSKRINHFKQYGNIIYISTDFAIIEYDIEHLVFGDTFYIGDQSTTVKINQTALYNNKIYAATEQGIYSANIANKNLIDFNNWQQPEGDFAGDFKAITLFNDVLYTSKDSSLYRINNSSSIQGLKSYSSDIIAINSSFDYLNVCLETVVYNYNKQLIEVNSVKSQYPRVFKLNNAFIKDDAVYLATKTHGILKKIFDVWAYEEIHPEGPLSNETFSIEVLNNNLWVVFGGQQDFTFNGLYTYRGYSHFNGEHWINSTKTYPDLLDITIDPNHDNKVYISSWAKGVLEIKDDELVTQYDYTNSGLEKRPVDWANNTCISSTSLDSKGDLWVTNGYVSDKIKQFDMNSSWTGYSFNDVLVDPGSEGLRSVVIDKYDTKWIETRNNGVLAINKNGTKVRALNEHLGSGSLPNNKVYAIASDKNNRIWIGTLKGLVRFDKASQLFELNNYNAEPIIIKLEGGTGDDQGQKLLGEQPITTIAVDGADNKWFGTQSGGTLYTNSSGQKTIHIFDKNNSPLPSNYINEIRVDDSTGKVYFATSKGLVAFNNNVSPFGDTLGETYAYPNPCTKATEFVTIDGRHGTHLPQGTNVKILDSAGYLVYETNVLEGIEVKGGKVIWNKKNLAGRSVASGVYIIMLTLPDTSETSITKVAIIN